MRINTAILTTLDIHIVTRAAGTRRSAWGKAEFTVQYTQPPDDEYQHQYHAFPSAAGLVYRDRKIWPADGHRYPVDGYLWVK
jgi:hypothetical protein